MENQQLVKLPTGRSNISFSEIKDWHDCSFRHKLKYIDRIDLREQDENSFAGVAIHDACRNFLKTKIMDDTIATDFIDKKWKENNLEKIDEWKLITKNILSAIPDFINRIFPSWECFDAEEEILEEINKLKINFRGFIDAIIYDKIKDTYLILDWKTSASGWHQYKKRSFIIKTQLIFYRNFWAKKHNIPLNKIKCGFIILKKNKKDDKCELFIFSVGKKSIKKSERIIENMINAMDKKIFIKNRLNCEYCDYKKTTFCPSVEF